MRVLVTAISGPTAVGIIKCLINNNQIELFGTDIYENSIGKKWIKESNFYHVSKNTDMEKYMCDLKKIIKNNKIDVIFPTMQEELESIKKISIELNIIAMIVDNYDLSRLLDKEKIYEDLYKMGFKKNIPSYECFIDPEDIENIIKTKFSKNKLVCFKKVFGHGGKGFFVSTINKNDYIINIDKNYIFIEDFIKYLEYNNNSEKYMICDFIDGEEISTDILIHSGKIISAVSRVRSRVSTGIVIDGKVEKISDVLELAKNISLKYNLEGFLNMQFIKNDTGIYLIDLNPRFCGSQIMSFGAGINFPQLMLDLYLNKEIKYAEPKWNVITKRYWESIFYDDKNNII